jgi:ABC-type Fe3+/spermidine/putrescine transport system ATPase subunit
MSEGHVQQVGAPRELYEHPANPVVAKFLGNNNQIRAMRLTSSNDPITRFKTLEGRHTLTVSTSHEQLMSLPVNKPCLLAIRPEAIMLNDKQAHDNQLAARIEHIEFGGATTMLTLDANGMKLEVLVLRGDGFAIGEQCVATLSSDQIRLLPPA